MGFETVFEGLDVLSNGGLAAAKLDELLFKDENGELRDIGMATRIFRKGLLALVRFGAPLFLNFLESDAVTINVNGQAMSGAELKEMREARRGASMAPTQNGEEDL